MEEGLQYKRYQINKAFDEIYKKVIELRYQPVGIATQWRNKNIKICNSWVQSLEYQKEFLSYEGMNALRFLKHLRDDIKCGNCEQIENFETNDNYCDACIENIYCENPDTCIFIEKYFTGSKTSTCPHFNFALESMKAEFWDYDRNYPYRPENFRACCGKKHWFICPKCPHVFQKDLNSITARNEWCPYCKHKALCDNIECKMCYDNSFYSNLERRDSWYYEKNKIHPRKVFKGDNDKYWFHCNKCKHPFDISPSNILNDKWCPFCVHQKLCDDGQCLMCHNNSFYSTTQRDYWDYLKNGCHPRTVFKSSSSQKYWFICENKHSFDATPCHITSQGTWCPFCKRKTEAKFLEWSQRVYSSNNVQREIRNICINYYTRQFFPYYFSIYNILIEIDGEQHFTQVRNWQSSDLNMRRDVYKAYIANLKGFHLIRIPQEDIWRDTFNWRYRVIELISQIYNDSVVKCHYIENPNIPTKYTAHKALYDSINGLSVEEAYERLNINDLDEEESKVFQ